MKEKNQMVTDSSKSRLHTGPIWIPSLLHACVVSSVMDIGTTFPGLHQCWSQHSSLSCRLNSAALVYGIFRCSPSGIFSRYFVFLPSSVYGFRQKRYLSAQTVRSSSLKLTLLYLLQPDLRSDLSLCLSPLPSYLSLVILILSKTISFLFSIMSKP